MDNGDGNVGYENSNIDGFYMCVSNYMGNKVTSGIFKSEMFLVLPKENGLIMKTGKPLL